MTRHETNGLGLNGATLPGCDLLTGIAAVAAAGFTHYEPRVPALEAMIDRAGEVRATLATASLAWLPLNALEGLFVGPTSTIEDRAGTLFSLAASFGIPQVIAVPGPVDEPPTWSAALAQLAGVRDLAAEHGVSVLYELLGFAHFAFPSLAEARALARESGLRLVLDTFHLAVGETPPEEIARLRKGEIGLVHISDAVVASAGIAATVDADRVLPGDGQLALAEIVGAIQATGFRGPYSVEVFHPKYGDLPPEDVAREAFSRTTALLAAGAEQGTEDN